MTTALLNSTLTRSCLSAQMQTSLLTNDAGFIATLVGFDTDDLAEGVNKYWSQALFDAALGAASTSDLNEGANLYWTSVRFADSFATRLESAVSFGDQVTFAAGVAFESLNSGGGILYANDSGVVAQLGVGTVGQCLKSTASVPAWGACEAGSALTGTGVAGQLSYFDSESSVVGIGDLIWDNDTKRLSIVGSIDMTGDIVPTTDNTHNLGSPTHSWKDVYIGPGSLYINGQKVLQEESSGIVMSADAGQNLGMQVLDGGDLELAVLGSGQIQLKGNVQLAAGKSIATSDGLAVAIPSGVAAGNLQLAGNTIANTMLNGDIVFNPNGSGDSLFMNGNVGVGTSNPQAALDVVGAINATNLFSKWRGVVD